MISNLWFLKVTLKRSRSRFYNGYKIKYTRKRGSKKKCQLKRESLVFNIHSCKFKGVVQSKTEKKASLLILIYDVINMQEANEGES